MLTEKYLLGELEKLRLIAEKYSGSADIAELLAISDRVVAVAEEIRRLNS